MGKDMKQKLKFTAAYVFFALVGGLALAGPAVADASCATVMSNSPTYTVGLQDGAGNTASATMNFTSATHNPGFHHNIALSINGGPTQWFDVVSDPCTNDGNGNAVFNLHPQLPTGGVDTADGDKWTFSLPAPSGAAFAVTDTTGSSFNNPVTAGGTGAAITP